MHQKNAYHCNGHVFLWHGNGQQNYLISWFKLCTQLFLLMMCIYIMIMHRIYIFEADNMLEDN